MEAMSQGVSEMKEGFDSPLNDSLPEPLSLLLMADGGLAVSPPLPLSSHLLTAHDH